MEKVNSSKKALLMEIVFLQTIGPLLVVLGHSMNGLPANDMFQALKSFIYVFHMPLFFFVAGMLFVYSSSRKKVPYKEYIKKKASRLLLPYLIWNLSFLIPKILVQSYLADKVELSIGQILTDFVTPRLNIWGHTWFLVAIFIVYSIAPLLYKLYKRRPILFYALIALSFVLSCFPLETYVMALSDLSKNFVFFLIGMVIFEKREQLAKPKGLVVISSLFVVSFVTWILFNNRITTVFLCLFALLLLLGIGILLSKKMHDNIISQNSMTFYLFHWPFMVATRVLFYQKLHFGSLPTAALMFVAGIAGPIIVILIINKFKLREKSRFVRVAIGG